MKNFEDFISEWMEANPRGCRTLAAAVIYAYFTETNQETDERLLSLDVTPDAWDLNNVLIDAIRGTNLIDKLEDIIGERTAHCW